jgi:putative phosphoribosyl transferase
MFVDRVDAGRQLARQLEHLRGQDVVVLGLPRGGVPVAYEVAEHLEAPLDVVVVRKLGLPFQPEVAMGAIGEGGVRVLDQSLIARAGVTPRELEDVERCERATLEDRVARLRRGRTRVDLHGRVAVIVDDGLATGSTARVACEVVRRHGAAHVVLAVPVAPRDSLRHLQGPDEIVCVSAPGAFLAVGHHYRDFTPTTDDEVAVLLDRAARRAAARLTAAEEPDCDEDVMIPVRAATLSGHLYLPEPARGVVVFAHGSGSSRHSPRNRFVASVLRRAGLGTLLLDLLTPAEETDRTNVFDISLLAGRLVEVTNWLSRRRDAAGARIGYFGASTGAGAALWAAAEQGQRISAVVSRGGRPDLAAGRLAQVTAPTLLIVGGDDRAVLGLNRSAAAQLRCPHSLVVVPGATHLFEEPGALGEVAALASDWFTRHLLDRAADSTHRSQEEVQR